MQESAALILAYAVLVDYRIQTSRAGEIGVLRISFLKTLQVVQGLWQFLEVSADLLGFEQMHLVVQRALRRIAEAAIPQPVTPVLSPSAAPTGELLAVLAQEYGSRRPHRIRPWRNLCLNS
jgi:hypothetical protein